jgi:hypothetical protein
MARSKPREAACRSSHYGPYRVVIWPPVAPCTSSAMAKPRQRTTGSVQPAASCCREGRYGPPRQRRPLEGQCGPGGPGGPGWRGQRRPSRLRTSCGPALPHWICRSGDPERYVRRVLANASTDWWRRLCRRPEMALSGDEPGGRRSCGLRRRTGLPAAGAGRAAAAPARRARAAVLVRATCGSCSAPVTLRRAWTGRTTSATARPGVTFAGCAADQESG